MSTVAQCPFDHHDPSLRGDLLDGIYDDLRASGPLVWSTEHGGFWIVTGYEDIRSIELDTETYSCAEGVFMPRADGQIKSVALEQDPPEHTAFRKLYNELLSRPAIAQHEEVIRSLVERHVAAFVDNGGGEFMADVAGRIPVDVVSFLLGLPDDIRVRLRELSEEAWRDRFGEEQTPQRMAGLLMGEAMQRLEEPRDDFLTHLVQSHVDGRPIAPDEVVNFLLGAAIAGHETTMNAAGNLCHALARDPDLQQRIREDRSLVPALVEETLRLDAPVQNFFRYVTRDHELHGQQLRAGDRVMLVFGAGNHDPDRFEDPHNLSIDRTNNRHLSFGWGIHRCAGANLAQMELGMVANRLLDAPPFELAGEAEYSHMVSGGTFVGLTSLPVRFEQS